MTHEEILNGLKEILSKIKPNADLSNLSDSTRLVEDLGIDSLSMILMSISIEQKFDFNFSTQKPFQTVGEVIEYISKASNK
ncbi:MAG: phosphopantetheine-binding protein [Bacteroidales bacterium]|nr:phosphopantetheine-binding protein [Bacteroidales bacterium]